MRVRQAHPQPAYGDSKSVLQFTQNLSREVGSCWALGIRGATRKKIRMDDSPRGSGIEVLSKRSRATQWVSLLMPSAN